MIPFGDDDRIFFFQLSQVGKCRAEHRMGRNIRKVTCLVKFFQVRLDRCDIRDDTVWLQVGHDTLECFDRIA